MTELNWTEHVEILFGVYWLGWILYIIELFSPVSFEVFPMWLLKNAKLQMQLTLHFTGQHSFRQLTSLFWAKQDATDFITKEKNNPPFHKPGRGIRHWKSVINTTSGQTPNDWRGKLALWTLKVEKWPGVPFLKKQDFKRCLKDRRVTFFHSGTEEVGKHWVCLG